MAGDIALGIVIGGAVSATFGKAVKETTSRIGELKKTANETRMWQRTIGDTVKLQEEFRRLHNAGDSAAEGVRRKLDANLKSLRDNGIEVGRLDREYARLGKTVRGLDMKAAGHERFAAGKEGMRNVAGDAVKFGAAVAVPATVAANYQAIIRDIAIKAGIARTQEETDMGARIRKDASAAGLSRNEMAEAINQMVAAGMDVDKALNFGRPAAEFAVSQGATASETAKMIQALQQNAKISDPAQMSRAMEAIAYLGKAGSFESIDMARWFPVLLAEMQKIGITGQDSVTQLGAMLQVQMKTAGNADEAANNLKNWFSKIGSGETERNYTKAGIDYQAKMREAIGKGWSTLEASFVLARAYIERVDPKKAQQLAEAAKGINAELDPEKRRKQIAAFEDTMKTGDLFNDMQVKAALTAYMQNADLYQQLKKESATATGEIKKDLADRRDSSKQLWSEVGQEWNDAMRSIGDALRPVTDAVGAAAKGAGEGLRTLTDSSPKATLAVAGVASAFLAYRGLKSTYQIGRGVFDIARGTLMARGGAVAGGKGAGGVARKVAEAAGAVAGGVQRVYVVNLPGAGFGGGGGIDVGGGAAGAARTAAAQASGAAARVGRFSRVGEAVRGVFGRVAPALGRLAAMGTVFKIGMAASDAFAVTKSDMSREDKAKGLGGVAGSLAGGMVGAKIGATVGLAGGPIGAAIGGVVGGLAGSFIGEKALGKAAQWMFAAKRDTPPESKVDAQAIAQAKSLGTSSDVSKTFAKIEQQNTFAPIFNIKVEGDSADAGERAFKAAEPMLRRWWSDQNSKNNRAAMFDSAHL
ncbi:phage tail tape measure protein [Pandoraea sp. ISTKB]|uniref:phage tail tape measure protein n=1 Tax=Pandoraea sp. ISTKB TaxID=1586708 RepID=UPI00084752AC|nr:phage tail tape measure protein [Pandoraea sp. ISTKB]ODP33062.1 phage tail tape measure protein [Pandoraea sp. ISTKB]